MLREWGMWVRFYEEFSGKNYLAVVLQGDGGVPPPPPPPPPGDLRSRGGNTVINILICFLVLYLAAMSIWVKPINVICHHYFYRSLWAFDLWSLACLWDLYVDMGLSEGFAPKSTSGNPFRKCNEIVTVTFTIRLR